MPSRSHRDRDNRAAEEAGEPARPRAGRAVCTALSRSRLKALILDGQVTSRAARSAIRRSRVNSGDTDHRHPAAARTGEAPQAEAIPLNIVYEDDRLIVIDKPPGWWCIRPPGTRRHAGQRADRALRRRASPASAA